METYKIPVQNMLALEAELAKLNKRAVKLGIAPAVLSVVGTESKEFCAEHSLVRYTQVWNVVTISGETPKLDGWKLIAVIEKLESGENLLSVVPGETCPEQYRQSDGVTCEHCNRARRRSEVFVVAHDDGRTAQVGRQCLADFLGGKSPEGIVAYAQWGLALDSVCRDAESDYYWGCGRGQVAYSTDEFLKLTAAVIRVNGWLSKSVAMEQGRLEQCTAYRVEGLLVPPRNADALREHRKQMEKLAPCAADFELGQAALAWGRELPTDQGDYLYNLGVACRLGYVTPKTTGIVCSLIAAYQRHLDKQAELVKAREVKNRQHVGTVGERAGFAQVTIKAIRAFEGNFGARTLVRFEDATGSILCWWTSEVSDAWKEGETLDITATVKKHDDWKGTPQTIITRVVQGLPKVKKSKRAAA